MNSRKVETFVRNCSPSWNTFASNCIKLLSERSMVSSRGNDANASLGNVPMKLFATINVSNEPPSPANESTSMQSMKFPLKSKNFNFFKLRMARDGISINSLWCNDNSHNERSRPSNTLSVISASGLLEISMR